MKRSAILIATLLACSALVAGCSNSGGSGYQAESRCADGKAAGTEACKTGAGAAQDKPVAGY